MTSICPHCGQEMPVSNTRFDGAQFRRLRVTYGMSLREISEKTGLRPAMISDIERGTRGVSEKTRDTLAQALGVHPWSLMTDRM